MRRMTRTPAHPAPAPPLPPDPGDCRRNRRTARRPCRATGERDGTPSSPRQPRRSTAVLDSRLPTPDSRLPIPESRSHREPALAGGLHERQQLVDLGEVLQVRLGPLQRLRQIEIRPEQQAIGSLELHDRLVAETVPTEPYGVEPSQPDRVADSHHKWRHILRYPGGPA